ncbi:hypothetical protein DFJ43DRAFT_466013, partial [Lentinula guzmanii]
ANASSYSYFSSLPSYPSSSLFLFFTIFLTTTHYLNMSIYLPQPPEPASPSKRRPDTTQLNDRRRIIDNRRALKRIMTECIVYRLKQAPPSFGFTVESSSSFKIDYRFKKTLKSKGVKLIEEIIKGTMNWSDLDKADLALYQKLVGRLFVSKGLFHIVKHLQLNPESLSPSSITSLVEGLLIELGQGSNNITVAKIQAMAVICLKDLGHIYRRWQPLAGFQGTVEEAQELSKRIFFDDFLHSLSTQEAKTPNKGNTKKRGREEEPSLEGQSTLKKAKFADISNRTSLLQRFKRKRSVA